MYLNHVKYMFLHNFVTAQHGNHRLLVLDYIYKQLLLHIYFTMQSYEHKFNISTPQNLNYNSITSLCTNHVTQSVTLHFDRSNINVMTQLVSRYVLV